MKSLFCAECADEFFPIESRESFVDPDGDPVFCSVECADAFYEAAELSEAYDQAGDPAPAL